MVYFYWHENLESVKLSSIIFVVCQRADCSRQYNVLLHRAGIFFILIHIQKLIYDTSL